MSPLWTHQATTDRSRTSRGLEDRSKIGSSAFEVFPLNLGGNVFGLDSRTRRALRLVGPTTGQSLPVSLISTVPARGGRSAGGGRASGNCVSTSAAIL